MRVGHVADALGALLDRQRRLAHFLFRLDANAHQDARHVHLDDVEHLREQLERLALVFLLRVLLRVAAQVDALAQVVERGEVLAPVLVDRLQQDHAHERRELLDADARYLAVEQLVGSLLDVLDDVFIGHRIALLDQPAEEDVDLPLLAQHLLERLQVPLLLDALGRHVGAHDVFHRAPAQAGDLRRQVRRLEDVVALLIDHLALVVGDVVVLEQLLSDVEVARLDLPLRALDRARDDARLDRLAVGHLEALHDRADAISREDAHERIVEAQVEARRARVALAARATAQLVVDAPALVPLGGDDAQAALRLDGVVQALPLVGELLRARRLFLGRDRRVGVDDLDLVLDVAAEHDVGSATGHVGGDRDHARAPGLRHDLGFLGVLLGVEHRVRQLGLLQQAREQLGVLDRRRADEHRLAARVAIADVLDYRLELLARRLVDEVELVLADGRQVGRDHNGLEAVDLLELVGLGVGRPGHARELAVHAEVVLEGDRGERLVLALDRHAFLRLHRLVQAIAPAPAGHEAPRELVDDDDFGRAVFARLDDVMLVAVVQVPRAQSRVHVVHQRDVGRVVQARALDQQAGIAQQLLGVLVAVFGEEDLVRLLVDGEVARIDHALAGAQVELADLLLELRDDGVDAHVHLGVVLGLTADDERRARLVDQDRVDLVDDRVRKAARDAVSGVLHHVVAQVVEAELVVGAVGDVGSVGGLLVFLRHVGQVHAHPQAEEAVEPSHPLGVAPRQVVVDGDDVDALALQRIEIDRQRRHQRLALAGAHLGDLAGVQRHAADQLDVEVAHLEGPLARLADSGEGLGKERVERLAGGDASAELFGLGTQLGVAQLLERRLERVDLLHDLPVLLEQPVVATAEDRGEKLGQHRVGGKMKRRNPGRVRAPARRAETRLELRPAGMNARRERRPRGAEEPEI